MQDPIIQIIEDGVRHILYSRSEKGSIRVGVLILTYIVYNYYVFYIEHKKTPIIIPVL